VIDYSNPFLLGLGRVVQRAGINRPIVRLMRRITGYKYEDAFDSTMQSELRVGDEALDIGANIGYFTKNFSQRVGTSGAVYAVEPSPPAFKTLYEKCGRIASVVCENIALTSQRGKILFKQSADGVDVSARTADDYTAEKPNASRNVVKLDVKGFEDVISRMSSLLLQPKLRARFIELHFQELNKRGRQGAPGVIVGMPKTAGVECVWADPSHLSARRM
jgi:tRNA A58 N-methylase Trm61